VGGSCGPMICPCGLMIYGVVTCSGTCMYSEDCGPPNCCGQVPC
jgi:hypothetical protein